MKGLSEREIRLKKTLDSLYEMYNNEKYILNDPIEFPHRYSDSEDILIVGFISALFAFGRVELFKGVLSQLFERLGNHPSRFLKISTKGDIKGVSKGLNYRFYSEEDISNLLLIISHILRESSIIRFFEEIYRSDSIITALSQLNKYTNSLILKENIKISSGMRFMLPDIKSGSPVKRLMMFSRWMIRKDRVDFGIIKSMGTRNLIIPLDTHTAHIARLLNMTRRRSNDLICAIEITNFLRRFDDKDPVRYDFALAHTGISDGCRHRYIEAVCSNCLLKEFCNNR
jgi:uncharacterized protein (TIGR02757 family)